MPAKHGLDEYERCLYDGSAADPARGADPAPPLPTGLDVGSTGFVQAVRSRVLWAIASALSQAGLSKTARLGLVLCLPSPGSNPDVSWLPSWLQEPGWPGVPDFNRSPIIVLKNEQISLSALLSGSLDLLDGHPIEAVLVLGIGKPAVKNLSQQPDAPSFQEEALPEAAVLVLKPDSEAAQSGPRIYARLESFASQSVREDNTSLSTSLTECLSSALEAAGKSSRDLGRLELISLPGISIAPALIDLSMLFGTNGERGLAVGFSDPDGSGSMELEPILGLIRSGLGISRRVIFGYSPDDFPAMQVGKIPAPFYLPVWSRSWFLSPTNPDRCMGILERTPSGGISAVILADGVHTAGQAQAGAAAGLLARSPVLMFPVVGDDFPSLNADLDDLREQIQRADNLIDASRRWLEDAQANPAAVHSVCILGRSREDTLREIDFAVKGLEKTWNQEGEWQTPLGSYLTTKPLGGQGSIAFVYPGAFNSYPGIGKDLLYLFPGVFDAFSELTSDVGKVLCEKYLFPRSSGGWTNSDLQQLESRLSADSVSMLTSGSGLAVIYTIILQELFQVKPAFTFGYSLGEISMLYALRVWREGDTGTSVLASTPLFQSRLSGAKLAVRDYWQQRLGASNNHDETPWANYLMMTEPAGVIDKIQAKYPYVFLTHINAPRQIVIAGDPAHCQELISQVNAPSLRAPFDHVLHCDAMVSEFDEIARINTWDLHPVDGIRLYSAANYQPISMEKSAVAASIAKALTSTLDFPRLIQRVYDDGARIFIEVGAGSNCSKWVSETLKQHAHASFSVNRRGTDDITSLIRLLSRLISHRVPLNLFPLFFSSRTP